MDMPQVVDEGNLEKLNEIIGDLVVLHHNIINVVYVEGGSNRTYALEFLEKVHELKRFLKANDRLLVDAVIKISESFGKDETTAELIVAILNNKES